MDTDATLPLEVLILGWSVILLLVQIGLQGMLATRELGGAYNASARDDERQPVNLHAGRAARALRNLMETYPAFVGLALALVVTGQTGGLGAARRLRSALSVRHPLHPQSRVGRLRGWPPPEAGLLLMLTDLLA